jgi:CRISPR-associated endonuclease/helicase Cas3
MGPLDSIIQVAGRCNRKKRIARGDVTILNLVDQKKRQYSKIYDKSLLSIVYDIFTEHSTIEEKEFLETINSYFNKSREKINENTTVIKAIFELNYQKSEFNNGVNDPISSFKLIDDDLPDCDVFIEFDDNASKLWKLYLETQQILDSLERKKKFLTFKKEFYDYVISIPLKDAKSIVDTQHGINRIPRHDLEKYYDWNIGFKRGNPVTSIFG